LQDERRRLHVHGEVRRENAGLVRDCTNEAIEAVATQGKKIALIEHSNREWADLYERLNA
jgi:hypothetical protein